MLDKVAAVVRDAAAGLAASLTTAGDPDAAAQTDAARQQRRDRQRIQQLMAAPLLATAQQTSASCRLQWLQRRRQRQGQQA